MREAVIVSTARTPLAKSHRGEFNQTPGAQLVPSRCRLPCSAQALTPA